MDARLIAWARQVKSRQGKSRHVKSRGLPVLWLFADPDRLPDPRPSAARLPRGLCGVVLRHPGPAAMPAERLARLAVGRGLARICRERRLALVVAGDPWLAQAVGAGIHVRRGRADLRARFRRMMTGGKTRGRWITGSAHDLRELRRARLAGVMAAFLSPCFPTGSHRGASVLGPRRWSAIARHGGVPVLALGGMTGARAAAVPKRQCAGAGAITALMATIETPAATLCGGLITVFRHCHGDASAPVAVT